MNSCWRDHSDQRYRRCADVADCVWTVTLFSCLLASVLWRCALENAGLFPCHAHLLTACTEWLTTSDAPRLVHPACNG
jgi:hypothetical protein